MDLEAFLQENKRWLVGCAVGGLVWLVGSSIVGGLYDPGRVSTGRGAISEAYGRAELEVAEEESESLKIELARLKEGLSFVVSPKYGEWLGPVDKHVFLSGIDLKGAIADSASDRDVIVDVKEIAWEVPTGIDESRQTLIGLDIIDEIQTRLFAAHDASKQRDEDAMGLVAIDSLKLDSTRSSRSGGRSRNSRRGSAVDIADLLSEQKVSLEFQADESTIASFLEQCRKPGRTLALDRIQVSTPARPGEPAVVKAALSGISFLN
jgi:hypothetical protein